MTINGRKYDFAGLQAKGTVSVGSGVDKNRPGATVRTITDVGAGRVSATSTDAINGSQLYALATEVEKGWNVATSATKEGSKTGDTTAAKVINGETVTFTAGKNIAINQQDKNITVKTEDDVTFTNVKSDKVDATTVKAGDLTVTGKTQLGDIEVRNGSTINMGNNRITNVGTPTDAKDATNKEYVDNGRTQVTSTDSSVTIVPTEKNGAKVYDLKVNADLKYEGDTGSGTNKLSDKVKFSGTKNQIETVAQNGDVNFKLAKKVTDSLDKADSAMQEFTVGVDANHQATGIKVDQKNQRFDIIGTEGYVNTTVTGTSVQVDIAQDFKDKVANNTKNIADNKQSITNNANNIADNSKKIEENKQNITNNTNNITKNAEAIAKGFGLEAQDGNNVTKQLGEKVKVVGGNQNINTKVEGNELKINLNDTLDLTAGGSVKTGATTVNDNGLTITGGPSVTKTGINAGGKKITNVEAGEVSENSKEAVNGSQLHATNQNVTKNATDITNLNNTVKAGWELQVGGQKVKNVTPTNNVANFIAGDNIAVTAEKDGSVKIATQKDVTFDNVTANNGLTVKKGATINMGDNVVTNVANGKVSADSTDAVNGSQLHQTNQNVTNLGNKLTAEGLNFVGDNKDQKVHRNLGETLSIVGGATQTDLSENNIGVVGNPDGSLAVKLAKTLNGLTSATFTNNGQGNTVINGNGVTITPANGGADKTVSLTDKGLNNGGNTITNVAAGVNKTDAVNVSQLEKVNATAKAGWNLAVNDDAKGSNIAPNATVRLNNKDGNIKIAKDANNNVTFDLNDTVNIGSGDKKVTIDGTKGTVNGLTNRTFDPKNIVNGQAATEDQLQQVHSDLNTNITNASNDLINKGLSFVGDNTATKVHRKLGETLSVVGNADVNKLSDKNIGVVGNDQGELVVKLAKELTDLTSANFTANNANTTINGNGVTIKPATGGDAKTVSLTDKGLNNGNNTITNVAEGKNGTDAVNVNQLERVNVTANAGWNISANGANSTNVGPKGNVSLNNTDGNIVITKGTTDNNVTFALNNNLTVGKDGKDGKDGVDGQIGVNGKDGSSVVLNGKDGSIGLTGPRGTDGKDGASANISVADGKPGLDGKPGETKTRIVYETKDDNGQPVKEEVATLNDGLNFIGNQGEKIAKKLNDTLAVKGTLANDAAASSENVRVDSQDGALVVKLAQNLANLTTATFGNTATDKTVVGKDGVTISADKPENTVSLTDKGLNNGNNQITNVTSGLTDASGNKADLTNAVDTNAVNVGDLKETVKNITTDGFGLKDDKGTEVKQDLGKTIQIKGKDGVTVTADATDKALVVALEGDVVVNGKDGKDGTIGVKGADGKDGTTITKDAIVFNGVDGVNGKDGKDGAEGKAFIKVEKGAKGIDGNDGKDGESKTRIVYEKPNGDKEEVATLKDGLHFVGDNGDVIAKKLNETLAIKGNLTSTAEVTDKNLRVDNEGGQLIVKMAKVLTDLTSATFTDAAGNNTIIGGNGVTITPKAGDSVSLTDKGLNNGNNTITNVKAGLNGTDAVNVNQLEKVNATAKAGWKLTNNGTNESTVTPNATVDLANKDGNIIITKDGNNVTFGFNSDLTVGGPGKDGKDGKDGSIGVKGKDGTTGVTLNGKDGSIGLTGAPGKDGNTATVGTVQDEHGSAIKVTGADGKSETRINNVADGKADNDAVNVRQLKGVAQNVANIDNRVSKLDKRVRGIGANSAAASSLPQVMLPGKSMVAVAGGAYSGASAVAVGYSRASDNGKVILKVNGTANSAGHYSGGVGVGYQW
ncbi:YadA-like family protein [Actinobacillus equuli subsp. equuli]|uniref:YadA-like family protein n=1 Tax=Actinobacillus equuli subsp. equuli TaxID=202947 RepID=A0A9X4G1V7_ACTEU|nr:YadA-like family protein [Actinobacillus equuli]MDE8033936.1 YadA-like family protein [Actinobacillus equuli subsp. equuli]